MLSAYRPGSTASPFENYCTSALAYFLNQGHEGLGRLFSEAAAAPGERVREAWPQREPAPGVACDLLLELSSGQPVIVEVQVEAGADQEHLPTLQGAAAAWFPGAAFVMVCLSTVDAPRGWAAISWRTIGDLLRGEESGLGREFAEFIDRDVLGLGAVPLDEAIATNRLYALGAAAVRRRFGEQTRYVNSASRPMGGRYRYIGTTFSLDGSEMNFWIGLVNESIPLSDHYYLMLASKEEPVDAPSDHPRATSEWKWGHWTTQGRVVRPLTAETYDELLRRIRA